jgi:hypothetical protein
MLLLHTVSYCYYSTGMTCEAGDLLYTGNTNFSNCNLTVLLTVIQLNKLLKHRCRAVSWCSASMLRRNIIRQQLLCADTQPYG